MRFILVVLFLLPTASAVGIDDPFTSTPTTLYMHLSGFETMPINTQVPEDRFADPANLPLLGPSMCLDDPTGTQQLTSRQYHTYYGFSSPSYVEYDVDQDGRPRIHQERGLSYDPILDSNVTPVFHWYMIQKPNPIYPGPPLPHPPVPDVIVQATLRQGDEVSIGDTAFNTGKIVMQGASEATTLAGAATQENAHVTAEETVDGWLYSFAFPLTLHEGIIDQDEGFNIRIDVMMDEPVCEDGYTMLDEFVPHTDRDHRPRLELAVMNPLRIEAFHASIVGDDLIFFLLGNSPWGSYDVSGDHPDEPGVQLNVTGPNGPVPVELIERIEHTRSHGESEFKKPLQTIWGIWNQSSLPFGDYQVRATISNDQQTATATATMTMRVSQAGTEVCYMEGAVERCHSKGRAVDVPGLGVPLAMLGIAALATRRRA